MNFYDNELWNFIVKDKEIYYQRNYIDAFYRNNEGQPFLAYAREENNYVFSVFLKRDISKEKEFNEKIENNTYFDIITPYGYGGVDIKGEKSTSLLDYFFYKFNEYCKNNKIVSEFVRLNPISNNQKFYKNQDYKLESISKTIYMRLENEQQIWNEMESRCRNTIRKALKANLVINSGFDSQMFKEFIEIYSKTMQRDNAKKYYFFNNNFFENIQKNMNNNAKIYTAYLDNKAISSLIVIYNGKNAHYHLSGSLENYMKLGANNLLLYEVAKDMCSKGYKKLHLGGGYGGDDSPLFKFKKSFNKNGELDFYVAKKIFNQEKYDKLVDIKEKEKEFNSNSNFFPLYRS